MTGALRSVTHIGPIAVAIEHQLRVSAERFQLQAMFSRMIHRCLDQLFTKTGAFESFLHIGVIEDHAIGAFHAVGEFASLCAIITQSDETPDLTFAPIFDPHAVKL